MCDSLQNKLIKIPCLQSLFAWYNSKECKCTDRCRLMLKGSIKTSVPITKLLERCLFCELQTFVAHFSWLRRFQWAGLSPFPFSVVFAHRRYASLCCIDFVKVSFRYDTNYFVLIYVGYERNCVQKRLKIDVSDRPRSALNVILTHLPYVLKVSSCIGRIAWRETIEALLTTSSHCISKTLASSKSLYQNYLQLFLFK